MCPLNWWYRRWSNLVKWPRHSATWWFYVRLTSQQIFSDCIYRFKCVRLHDSLCRYLGNICIAKQLQYELMPVKHLRAIVKTGQEEYITDIGRMNEALQEAGCAFITLIQKPTFCRLAVWFPLVDRFVKQESAAVFHTGKPWNRATSVQPCCYYWGPIWLITLSINLEGNTARTRVGGERWSWPSLIIPSQFQHGRKNSPRQ